MYANSKLKMHGLFKVDVYDGATNQLKNEGDYFANYITESGLSYPFNICFAETFRFLHVGSGATANDINTKSLEIGIPEFSNLVKYFDEGCGYTEHLSGVSLFRAWRIPELGTLRQDYQFNEFGVSPNYTGYDVAVNTQKFYDDHIEWAGVDFEDIPIYYKASGYDSLFARAIESVDVFSGDFAVISYKLNLSVRTGIFGFNYSNTPLNSANANKDCGGNSCYDVWTGYSGLYRQFHHGLALVAPAEPPANINPYDSAVIQEPLNYNDAINETLGLVGGSFVPSMKIATEPSLATEHLLCYFSNDNLQFLVNPTSGGAFNGSTSISGKQIPYDPSGTIPFPSQTYYGLIPYQNNLQTLVDTSAPPLQNSYLRYVNARFRDTILVPTEVDFTAESTPIALLVRRHDSVSISKSIPSYRHRTVSRTFTFAAINNYAVKFESLKSVCMAFKGSSSFGVEPTQSVYPVLDSILVPASTPILPTIDIVTGVNGSNVIDSSNQGQFIFLDDCNTFGWTFNISWSSDEP